MDIQSLQGADGAGRIAPQLRSPQIIVSAGTATLNLTLAVCDYEHVRDLAGGVVRIDPPPGLLDPEAAL